MARISYSYDVCVEENEEEQDKEQLHTAGRVDSEQGEEEKLRTGN